MRRNYISPEYKYSNVYGTYNMVEESSFFGSKMLYIEDSISISNQTIIYYEALNHEQLDISVENSLPSILFDASIDKFNGQTMSLDQSQPSYQLDNNTKWIINIDLTDILANYLFATLKQYRTFEGVKNNTTIYNDVDFAIKAYIKNNVLTKYKLSNIIFYIVYKDIKSQNATSLKYQNNWNPTIALPSNILPRVQTQTSADQTSMTLMFTQEQPSNQYSFDYYFDLLFERI